MSLELAQKSFAFKEPPNVNHARGLTTLYRSFIYTSPKSRGLCIAVSTSHSERQDIRAAVDNCGRRGSILLAAAILLCGDAASGEEELAPFENARQNYRMQRPKEWEQVNKAGADALFKATNAKSTDIGVTVNAIKIKQLEQLGDVKAAGERLIAAERKKESTKSIEMLKQSATTAPSGTQFYNFDYAISTTRGDKRVVSKVGVANNSLYIVNGSIKCEGRTCKEETPLLGLVERSVASFDVMNPAQA